MPSTRVQIKTQALINVQNITLTPDADVTVGNLIVLGIVRWRSGSSSLITESSITQTAGTATISPVRVNYRFVGARNTVIASFVVTGTGSLTLQLAAPNTGNFGRFSMAEFTGQWTEARARDYSFTTGTSTTPSTGNVTTPDHGVLIGMMGTNAGTLVTFDEDPAFELIAEEEDGTTTETSSFIDRVITAGGATDAASWTVSTSVTWDTGAVMFREGGVFPARMVV